MASLPSEFQFGYVSGQYVIAVGDTTADPDAYPDEVPAQGTVTFTPSRANQTTTTTVTTNGTPLKPKVNFVPIVCTLDPTTGIIKDTGGNFGVFLIAGLIYHVSVAATGETMDITPYTSHTISAPLDLNDPSTWPGSNGGGGTTPTPGVVVVDNGDGTTTATGTGVTDNGDGTYALNGTNVVDNGNGTYTTS